MHFTVPKNVFTISNTVVQIDFRVIERKSLLERASSTDAMQTSKGNGEVKGALSAVPAKTVFIT